MRQNINQFYKQNQDYFSSTRKNDKPLNLILEIDSILIHMPVKEDQNIMYEEEIEVIV